MFDQEQFNADLTTIYGFADKLFNVDTSRIGTLFHYTTADGLMGIIGSKSFRATNIKFLNDSKEYQYAREQMANGVLACLKRWHGLSFEDKHGHEVKEILYSAALDLERALRSDDSPPEVYVVCFCIEGDRVDQWKGYGGEGFGYSIGFRSKELANIPNCQLVTISYGKSALDQIISDCMDYSAEIIARHLEG